LLQHLYAPLMPAPAFPNRDLMPVAPCSVRETKGAGHMLDLIYLALGLGCFGLMAWYAALCSRL
jgi:hypothetical protein